MIYSELITRLTRPMECSGVKGEHLEPINEPTEVQTGVTEIFQWYVISENDVDILINVNEPVYFNNRIDMYMWGVCLYGPAWESVPLMFDKAIMPDNFTCNMYELSQLLGYSDFYDFCEDGHNAGWLACVGMQLILNKPRFNKWLKKMSERFRVLSYDAEKKVYNCKGGLL